LALGLHAEQFTLLDPNFTHVQQNSQHRCKDSNWFYLHALRYSCSCFEFN